MGIPLVAFVSLIMRITCTVDNANAVFAVKLVISDCNVQHLLVTNNKRRAYSLQLTSSITSTWTAIHWVHQVVHIVNTVNCNRLQKWNHFPAELLQIKCSCTHKTVQLWIIVCHPIEALFVITLTEYHARVIHFLLTGSLLLLQAFNRVTQKVHTLKASFDIKYKTTTLHRFLALIIT